MKAIKEENLSFVGGEESITVVRTRLDTVLSEDSEDNTIPVRKFLTYPAFVEVRAGVTRNMGNYESLRLDVGVRIPCYTEEISEAEKQATQWVDDKMSDKLDEIEKGKKAV